MTVYYTKTVNDWGRNLSDPKDCIVEYEVSPRSMSAVDHALLDSGGTSRFLQRPRGPSWITETD